MFTLPPRPPKDYVIKHVPKSVQSAPEFTPGSIPRVTQSTLAKFCSPIQYGDQEVPEKAIERINVTILDKWAKEARASWVDKPGQNDYYLHNVFKNFSVKVDPNYSPRYQNKEKIINRSFKYEPECLEEVRLQKLRKKCHKEHMEFVNLCRSIDEKAKEEPNEKACVLKPPFWWQEANETSTNAAALISKETAAKIPANLEDCRNRHLRWQNEPDLLTSEKIDPCQRRYDLLLVGIPFRSEACNWYNENYPTSNIKFHSKRFM